MQPCMSKLTESVRRKKSHRYDRYSLLEFVIACVVIILALALVFLSGKSDLIRYHAGEELLENLEMTNAQMDNSILMLFLMLNQDMDAATRIQGRMLQELDAYAEFANEQRAARLHRLVYEKLAIFEQIKSRQAVTRNSRAIASELLNDIIANNDDRGSYGRGSLAQLKAVWLQYYADRSLESWNTLSENLDVLATEAPTLSGSDGWKEFVAHTRSVFQNGSELEILTEKALSLAVSNEIGNQKNVLRREYEIDTAVASRYRLMLIAVVILSLVYGILKIFQVARFVQLLRRARQALEDRVVKRTQELASANESLHTHIDRLERMEDELRLAQKLESVGQLAAGIAHEINTPCQYVGDNVSFLSSAWKNVARMFDEYETSLIRGEVNTERARRLWDDADIEFLREDAPAALRDATSGLEQISKIVRAMKDFSHPGDTTFQPADINRAINSTITVARNEWKYVATVEYHPDESLPQVTCNLSALNQVLLNIIVNAAQAIGENSAEGQLGRILISARQAGSRLRIEIEDNGPGIPDAIRKKIFDPFFTTKDVGKGTGQGLAIAHRVITQQHNGTLRVESGAEGCGTRFVIELPLHFEVAEQVDDTPQENFELPGKRPAVAACES